MRRPKWTSTPSSRRSYGVIPTQVGCPWHRQRTCPTVNCLWGDPESTYVHMAVEECVFKCRRKPEGCPYVVKMAPTPSRPSFTNGMLRRAVKEYLAGGVEKQRIVAQYGEIGNWDVSKVTNMKRLFQNERTFNQPLNGWNVANVKNMFATFHRAEAFDQPLDTWNVSNVGNMTLMFSGARSFNQPLHAPWYQGAAST